MFAHGLASRRKRRARVTLLGQPRFVRSTLTAVLLASSTLVVGSAMPSHAATALPPVLPALQQWGPGSGGGFAWTPASRVVVNSADAPQLSGDAQTFASDLGSALGSAAPPVVTGDVTSAQPGDIFLGLGSSDSGLGNEGYRLSVAPVLQVSARAEAGAFWGTLSFNS